MMKNAFYFIFKALSVLKIFIFLSLLFDNGEKRLDKKDEVNYNANIAQYLMKSRQPENAIKFN